MTRTAAKWALPAPAGGALAAVAIATALASMSCDNDDWGPASLLEGKSEGTPKNLRRGQEQYSMYCVGCHGEKGDGEGPAARFLNPKPRDFRKGRVKFAQVPAGTLPRDEDLMATIDKGLHGTSMPSWRLVAEEDKRAMVAYIKTFSEVWTKEAPGRVVPIKPDPWRKKPAAGVAEGERVYHGMAACSSCHPAYAPMATIAEHQRAYDIPFAGFRDKLYESIDKESDWGAPIRPPDFLVDRTKAATTREELVQVIAAGVGGTAMPSWGDSLTPQQLWGLAYYVESLMQMRSSPEGRALQESLAKQPEYKPPPPPPPAPEPTASASAAASATANPATPPKGK